MLGEAAAHGRGVSLASVERRGRDGITGERPAGEIGFSVLRSGGIVGEHSVVFAAGEEMLTLSHSALDRGMFARGALAAARWIVGRAPGEYDMQDILGLSRKFQFCNAAKVGLSCRVKFGIFAKRNRPPGLDDNRTRSAGPVSLAVGGKIPEKLFSYLPIGRYSQNFFD